MPQTTYTIKNQIDGDTRSTTVAETADRASRNGARVTATTEGGA